MPQKVSTPSGFPELDPVGSQQFRIWWEIIEQKFQAHGFHFLETPLGERVENLLEKGGNNKEIYVLKRLWDEDEQNHSGTGLRFDHTVPLALYLARQRSKISFPFCRYAIGPVFRGERAQKGRFRQFHQADIDVIGQGQLSLYYDALMLIVMSEILEALELEDYCFRVSHRGLIKGFLASLELPDSSVKPLLDILDNAEKVSAEKTAAALKAQGLTTEQSKKLEDFWSLSADTFWEQAPKMCAHPTFQQGYQDLQKLAEFWQASGLNPKKWQIDLRIVRGLDYYTGVVYETQYAPFPSLGSICSGGRYDDLGSLFSAEKLPGVGISLGLSRLFMTLWQEQKLPLLEALSRQLLLVPQTEELLPTLLQWQSQWRASGVISSVYPAPKKIQKSLEYADKNGFKWVGILGSDEAKTQSITLRELSTKKIQTIHKNELSKVFV